MEEYKNNRDKLESDLFQKLMCHACETSFPNVETLLEHVEILHEGDEPYSCSKCFSFFFDETQYTDHESKHQKVGKSLKRKSEEPPGKLSTYLYIFKIRFQLCFVNLLFKRSI